MLLLPQTRLAVGMARGNFVKPESRGEGRVLEVVVPLAGRAAGRDQGKDDHATSPGAGDFIACCCAIRLCALLGIPINLQLAGFVHFSEQESQQGAEAPAQVKEQGLRPPTP
jgi:hypothetical protein